MHDQFEGFVIFSLDLLCRCCTTALYAMMAAKRTRRLRSGANYVDDYSAHAYAQIICSP